MKTKLPCIGHMRITRHRAWLPTHCDDDTVSVWMEHYWVLEEYKENWDYDRSSYDEWTEVSCHSTYQGAEQALATRFRK